MKNKEFKFRTFFAKCRNVQYYMGIDTRPRVVWMHKLREIREEAVSLREEYGSNPELERIIKLISPKIKNQECQRVINQIMSKYE